MAFIHYTKINLTYNAPFGWWTRNMLVFFLFLYKPYRRNKVKHQSVWQQRKLVQLMIYSTFLKNVHLLQTNKMPYNLIKIKIYMECNKM